MTKIEEVLEEVSESIGAKRVFGEPYEKNGVTIIPAARIMGGVGGGQGQAPSAEGETGDEKHGGTPSGSGVGYGLTGGPAGAFVISGSDVRWMPAVDVNRLMFGFQVVMIVFFVVMRSVMKARATARAEATQ